MATRFYLPSSGAAAVSPAYDAAWEDTTTVPAARLKCVLARIESSMDGLANSSPETTGSRDVLFRQYVSDPIVAQTLTAQTIKFQQLCREFFSGQDGFLALGIRVVSNDGTTVRGTILAVTRDNFELYPPGWQNRQFVATSAQVVSQAGDRIVVEIGAGGDPVSYGHSYALVVGDDSSTDLPENDSEINAYNPWVEFTQDVGFSGPATYSRTLIESFVPVAVMAPYRTSVRTLSESLVLSDPAVPRGRFLELSDTLNLPPLQREFITGYPVENYAYLGAVGNGDNWSPIDNAQAAQGFTVPAGADLADVWLYVKTNGSPTDGLFVEIQTDSAGLPSNTPVADGVSDTVAAAGIPGSLALVRFNFPTPPSLSADTQYHIVVQRTDAFDPFNFYNWGGGAATYEQGQAAFATVAGVWVGYSGLDMIFELYAWTPYPTRIVTHVLGLLDVLDVAVVHLGYPRFQQPEDLINLIEMFSIGRSQSTTLTDNLTLSDSMLTSTGRLLTDLLTMADTITKSVAKDRSEVLALQEVIVKGTYEGLTDSVTLADTITKDPHKFLTDVLTLLEALQKAITAILPTESLTLSDAIMGRSKTLNLADTLTLSDTITKAVAHFLADMLTLQDVLLGVPRPVLELQLKVRGHLTIQTSFRTHRTMRIQFRGGGVE